MFANNDDSDDSDIQEIAIIPGITEQPCLSPPSGRLAPAKRRKSSPQMDPLPSYATSALQSNNNTTSATESTSSLATTTHISHKTILSSTSTSTSAIAPPQTPPSRVVRRPPNSATALRPVTGPLAQAVARRRNSKIGLSSPRSDTSSLMSPPQSVEASCDSINVIEPIMWSPQLPSQIKPIKVEESDEIEVDEYATYKSPKVVKQRVAHKPRPASYTNKIGKPKMPLGIAKKVPNSLRIKYLEVIIDEYLSAGRPEDESYQKALKEEKSVADRSANRSIYINLVAGLRKRIREELGTSSGPQDQNPEFVNGNKVVSHDEILTGKVIGTISIERKRRNIDPAELSEYDLYDRLVKYLVPFDQLEAYNYPQPDPSETTLRRIPLTKDGQKQQLRQELASSYTCERCSKVYRVDEQGFPSTTTSKCIYHPGHLWNERINRALEKRYSCCKGDQSAGGCSSNPYHVHKGELEVANFRGYVTTYDKPELDPNKHGMYALDCEMCYTTYGLELTRVTVLDHRSEVVYEKLVKPLNPILDYNTKFSGIKEGDLDSVTTQLIDVQADLLKMFSSRSLLIGHSLDSDMKALKIFHKYFVDTAHLFPHKRGLPFKRALRTLMVENLRVIIQEDVGHDSKEDASAALRLVLWKMKTDVVSTKDVTRTKNS